MKKRVSKITSDVATGISSGAGASIGVVTGSVISQSVNAAEPEDTSEEVVVEEVITPNPPQPSQSQPQHPSQPQTQEPQAEDPQVTQPTQPTPTPPEKPEVTPPVPGDDTPEPEVQVMSYETVTNEDGSRMDVAVVAVDGQPVVVADLDQDGVADLLAVDENQNGVIEENEIHDISEQQLAMQPLQEAAGMDMGNHLAQADPDPDYVNDADVDDYMA